MLDERSDDSPDDFHVWPAFVDLLAATSLLFVTLVAVFIYVADARERGQQTEKDALLTRLQAADTSVYTVEDDGRFVRITLKEEATFPEGKYGLSVLQQPAKDALSRIGRVLMDSSTSPLYRQVRILGHTDSVGYRRLGRDEFTNWELSAARAAVVARYLVNFVGLNQCKVSAAGLGPYYPRAGGDGLPVDERRRRNRRIEIEIVPARAGGVEEGPPCSPYGDGTALRFRHW